MQSFLQYRAFGKHVEAQYLRDKEKAARNATNRSRRSSERPTSTGSGRHSRSEGSSLKSVKSVDTEDAEKSRNAVPRGVLNAVQTVSPRAPDANREVANAESDLQDETVTNTGQPPSERDRSYSQTIQRPADLERMGTSLGVSLTGIDVRTRTTNEGKGEPGLSQRVFVVGFEGEDDPLNPHNWGLGKRILCTISIASIGFVVGVASSIDSSALKKAAAEFGVSEVVESMAVGVFIHKAASQR